MKKFLALVLALTMVLSLAACGSKPAPEAPSGSTPDGGAAPANYKIAIITGTVSQGEEEFRAAEQMKAAYPDMVVTATYPDNFAKEQETTISNVLNLVSDESVKALVFLQAVPGASAAIAKAKELKPDLLVIAGVTGEDPAVIASNNQQVGFEFLCFCNCSRSTRNSLQEYESLYTFVRNEVQNVGDSGLLLFREEIQMATEIFKSRGLPL